MLLSSSLSNIVLKDCELVSIGIKCQMKLKGRVSLRSS